MRRSFRSIANEVDIEDLMDFSEKELGVKLEYPEVTDANFDGKTRLISQIMGLIKRLKYPTEIAKEKLLKTYYCVIA